MRRLHAGLVGLGLVLLVTALGTLALPGSSPAPSVPNEPLAELGVAPSPRPDQSPGLPGVGDPDPSAQPAGSSESPVSDLAPPSSGSDIVHL